MKSQQDFETILESVQFDNWDFTVGKDETRLFLQIRCQEGTCNVTGKPLEWASRKWPLSPYMTQSEVIQTAFKAVMTAMEHEVREKFLYKDRSIFGPHFHVDKLWELCDNPASLDERT